MLLTMSLQYFKRKEDEIEILYIYDIAPLSNNANICSRSSNNPSFLTSYYHISQTHIQGVHQND